MNTKFFIDGLWYKTPCKSVLNADTFRVKFFTEKHTIVAKVSDKCYFASIDNISLSDIKRDFHFSRNYTKPKEFLSNLHDTLDSFLSTAISFLPKLSGVKCPIHKNSDEILDMLFEEVIAIDREKSDTDPDVGKFVYDVVIHNFYGNDTYTVRADRLESAEHKALKIMRNECRVEDYYSIDSIRIYEENSDELLKEIIFEPTETEPETETETAETEEAKPVEIIFDENSKHKISNEYDETKELLAEEQFERLTRTLYKSLFKAIGLTETRKIPFIISNNMVFFNYNDTQYKYYPSQCKIFKKCGRKYQRINWKDFAEENNSDGQKQKRGRSPPFYS